MSFTTTTSLGFIRSGNPQSAMKDYIFPYLRKLQHSRVNKDILTTFYYVFFENLITLLLVFCVAMGSVCVTASHHIFILK